MLVQPISCPRNVVAVAVVVADAPKKIARAFSRRGRLAHRDAKGTTCGFCVARRLRRTSADGSDRELPNLSPHEQGREIRHRYTRCLIRKLNRSSPAFGSLGFRTSFRLFLLFHFFFFFFFYNDGDRRGVHVLVSFSLPFSFALPLFPFLFSFFFSISDCTTRIVRAVTREEVEWVLVREYVSARLERPHNGDTCQNNWHTGVSNLPRNRWRTSTSKESWSCVTASRPLSMNFRRPFGRRRIIELTAIKDACLHLTNVPFIKSMLLVRLFLFRRTTTRK